MNSVLSIIKVAIEAFSLGKAAVFVEKSKFENAGVPIGFEYWTILDEDWRNRMRSCVLFETEQTELLLTYPLENKDEAIEWVRTNNPELQLSLESGRFGSSGDDFVSNRESAIIPFVHKSYPYTFSAPEGKGEDLLRGLKTLNKDNNGN